MTLRTEIQQDMFSRARDHYRSYAQVGEYTIESCGVGRKPRRESCSWSIFHKAYPDEPVQSGVSFPAAVEIVEALRSDVTA